MTFQTVLPGARCPGSGLPVFLDYAGPSTSHTIPRCQRCRRVVKPDHMLNAPEHDA